VPQLLALRLPPGSGRRATPQDTRSAWWDMSLVRFDAGQLVPIGGWKRLPGIQLAGEPRSLLSWRDNAGLRWVAAASLGQVQVWDGAVGTVLSPGGFVGGEPAGIVDGFGIGDYGAEPYGVHRSHESEQFRAAPSDSVSLDNWGEDLVAMGSADGRLLMWTPSLPVTGLLQPVAGAPPGRACIVTEERHIVVIGADGDPRRVSWCSQEVPTDWAPSVTNTAGSLQLRSTGIGLAGRRVAQGTVIWCDDDVHLLAYVGTPYVYGLQRIGAGCGPAGPEAMVAMSGRAVWWGHHGFWLYDGTVRPLDCPLTEYLESDMNPVLRGAIYGYHNGIYPEVTWGYCSVNAATPDSYVTWNYETNGWWHGRQRRSIGTEPGAFGLPLLGAPDGKIYQHETGWLDDGNPRGASVFCETGDIQIGDGDAGIFVSSLLPDLQHPELVQWHLRGSWAPGDVLEDYGTYVAERADGIIDTCFETRALRLRLEGLQDGPWALGRVRLALDPGAGR
jgi:hypothetical protein